MPAPSKLSGYLKSLALYPVPHHLVSRLIFKLTRMKLPVTQAIIKWFIGQFNVDMRDSKIENLESFATFNEFFTRELKSDVRPISQDAKTLACPADGRISQIGNISEGLIVQAKNHDYSVLNLLGGDETEACQFSEGSFATVYLSPRDYHRIHMPTTGILRSMTHIPGRLFSVAPHTVENVPGLFARNERVVAIFDTDFGRMALVLVGAINVAAIETIWAGLVTPPAGKTLQRWDYHGEDSVTLVRGSEMGRFNMGSTVIMLLQNRISWNTQLTAGSAVLMGENTGTTLGNPDGC